MGLDIGAVQIKYMERPGGVALKFAWYLAVHSHEAGWEVGSDGNVIAEYDLDTVLGLVNDYVKSEGLGSDDKAAILKWVHSLPWKNDVVMLHVNW